MKLYALLIGVVLAASGPASADESPPAPQVCKASADCGPNAVCTAEGKCVQLAAPPPAPPPDKPGPSEADINAAKQHFTNGNVLFEEGNFAGALAEYLASYKKNPAPFLLKNIGYAHHRLFHYVEAVEALEEYLVKTPGATDTAEVTTIVDEIRNLLVEAKLAITPATGVTVRIDGREIGKTPLTKPLRVAAGQRVFELTADGYEPARQSLMVSSGVPLDLKFDLKLIPTTGKVRINSPIPRATVSIDGKPVGIVPLEVELPGGGHTIEVVAPDYQTHRGELVVTVGQTRDVNIALDRVIVVEKQRGKPWYKKWYVVAPLGAVVVGAGVGAYVVTRPEDPIAGTLAPGAGKIQ